MRRSAGEVIVVVDNLGVEVRSRDASSVMSDHTQRNILQIIDFFYLNSELWISKEQFNGGVGIIRVVWELLCYPDICWDASDSSLAREHKLVRINLEQLVSKLQPHRSSIYNTTLQCLSYSLQMNKLWNTNLV